MTPNVGQVGLADWFCKIYSVRFVVPDVLCPKQKLANITSNQFLWNNRKMCEKFDRKWAPWSASLRALSTSMRCCAAEAWVMLLKFSCTTKFEKAKNSLLKKNIYPESGSCNMEMKMLRKHISCERLGSEIALNLLSEHKLLVS